MTTNQETSLRERCAELAEWWDTGFLRDGRLRKLAATLERHHEHERLRAAERQTEQEAVRAVAARAEPQAGECLRLVPEKWLRDVAVGALCADPDLIVGEFDLAAAPAPASRAEPQAGESDPFKRIPGLHGVADAADYLAKNPGDEYAQRRLRERIEAFSTMHGLAPLPASRARPEAQVKDPGPTLNMPHPLNPPERIERENEYARGWNDCRKAAGFNHETLRQAFTPPAARAPGEVMTWLAELQEKWLASVAGKPLSRAIPTAQGDDYDNEVFAVRRCAQDLGRLMARLEGRSRAPGEVDGDVIHAAVAYFNGLNTKASLHMAAEIEKCYAALTHKEPVR